MKLTEAIENFKSKKLCCLAEYRTGKIEHKTGEYEGRKYDTRLISYNLEIDGVPFQVAEDFPKASNPDTYKIPYKKGDTVLVYLILSPNTRSPGSWRLRVRLEAVNE